MIKTDTKIKKSIFRKVMDFSHVKLDDYIEKARGLKGEVEKTSIDYDPWNHQEESGYKRKPTRINNSTLKRMSVQNSVISAIIHTRINQISSFSKRQKDKYSLGYLIENRDKNKEQTEKIKQRTEELYSFIENTGFVDQRPQDEQIRFEEFLRKIVRDRLIFDTVAIEKVRDSKENLSYFCPVDGSTISFAAENNKDGNNSYLSKYDTKREDVEKKDLEYKYVQVIDGTIFRAFTYDDLIFRMSNVTNDIKSRGYSISELELLIGLITSHLNAESYNKKTFTQGHVTQGILHFKANISQRKLSMFKRAWYAQTSGTFNSWRTPILAGMEEVKWIPLHQNNRDIEYHMWMEYCIKLICAIYLIDPAEINFDISQSRSEGNPLFTSKNEHKVKQSKDRGLRPLLTFIEDIINDILEEVDPDYVFRFAGLESEGKEGELERYQKELETYKTVNEIRKENNLDEIDLFFRVGDKEINPYDLPANTQVIQVLNPLLQGEIGQAMEGAVEEGAVEEGAPSSEGEEPEEGGDDEMKDALAEKREEEGDGDEGLGKSKHNKIKIEYFQLNDIDSFVKSKANSYHENDFIKGKTYPAGTIREWGGQKFIKHFDGWVVVGGGHHGKIFDEDLKVNHNHENKEEHKRIADGKVGEKKTKKEEPKKTVDEKSEIKSKETEDTVDMKYERRFPVGSHGNIGDLKVIRHSDGWVIAGGSDHGKFFDENIFKVNHNHENKEEHKKVADERLKKTESKEEIVSEKEVVDHFRSVEVNAETYESFLYAATELKNAGLSLKIFNDNPLAEILELVGHKDTRVNGEYYNLEKKITLKNKKNPTVLIHEYIHHLDFEFSDRLTDEKAKENNIDIKSTKEDREKMLDEYKKVISYIKSGTKEKNLNLNLESDFKKISKIKGERPFMSYYSLTNEREWMAECGGFYIDPDSREELKKKAPHTYNYIEKIIKGKYLI